MICVLNQVANFRVKTINNTQIVVSCTLRRRRNADVNVEIEINIDIGNEYIVDYFWSSLIIMSIKHFRLLQLWFMNQSCRDIFAEVFIGLIGLFFLDFLNIRRKILIPSLVVMRNLFLCKILYKLSVININMHDSTRM